MNDGMPVAQSEPRFPVAAERSVTVLGATGSIGASTIDLLKRERAHYRVESLSANTNGTALAGLARELGARFAAVGDPTAYCVLKGGLSGSGLAGGARGGGLVGGGAR